MYYQDNHFVWCSPVFDNLDKNVNDPLRSIDSTSCPKYIYETFRKDINDNNLNSEKIRANMNGLLQGMSIMLDQGVISHKEAHLITLTISRAPIRYFRPRLYLIPVTQSILGKLIKVPLLNAAHPLSEEYQIKDLNGSEFEIIEY